MSPGVVPSGCLCLGNLGPPSPILGSLIWVPREQVGPGPRQLLRAPSSLCVMTTESHYSSLSRKQLSTALIRESRSPELSSLSEGVCAEPDYAFLLEMQFPVPAWPDFQEKRAWLGPGQGPVLTYRHLPSLTHGVSPTAVALSSLGAFAACRDEGDGSGRALSVPLTTFHDQNDLTSNQERTANHAHSLEGGLKPWKGWAR